jgi:DNA-binding HxlR family transcriptional regulator
MKLRSKCPLSLALEIFGDKWTLLIIRDIIIKNFLTFTEFQKSDEKIAKNILSERLKKLIFHGIIFLKKPENNKKEKHYFLTQKGLDLYTIIIEITLWSEIHFPTLLAKTIKESLIKIKGKDLWIKMGIERYNSKVQKIKYSSF